MSLIFNENDLILFQGASVTDASRLPEYPQSLGNGYVYFTASWLWGMYPQKALRFLNRGVSGNTVPQLLDRWQRDTIDWQPNWVSIMAGMNDALRQMESGRADPQGFEDGYRRLIEWTLDATPAKMIMLESFLLPAKPEWVELRKYLDPLLHIERKLATEYKLLFIPLDGIFANAATRQEISYWTEDGIHPLPSGHALIEQSILRAAGARV